MKTFEGFEHRLAIAATYRWTFENSSASLMLSGLHDGCQRDIDKKISINQKGPKLTNFNKTHQQLILIYTKYIWIHG